MGPSLEAWLNGWVLSVFGPEGLIVFQAHPVLYGSLFVLLVLAAVSTVVLWSTGRLMRFLRSVRIATGLVLTGPGRQCLRHARGLRRSVERIRAAIRQTIHDKGERRSLLRILDGFSGSALLDIQEQALRLIQRGDDRKERALQARLDAHMAAWSAMAEGAERERLTREIAGLKHRLAQAAQANRQRDEWLTALEDNTLAVAHLELELVGLSLARGEHRVHLRGQLTEVAEQLGHLKQAHIELSDH